MTTVYKKRKFSFTDKDSGAVFADLEFRDCEFQGCTISMTTDPKLRSTVRNVTLVNCAQRGCSIETAIVEDVVVDGLNTHGQLVQTWGAVFNRVVLRGKLGRLMISPVVDVWGDEPHIQEAFDKANAMYYRRLKWALDISQAEFSDLDIRGVPAKLIRRDPETQIVVTREKALQGKWRKLPLKRTVLHTTLSLFLEDNTPDIVLAAPKRSRRFREYLADLKLLQKAGVAEPD